MMKVNWTVTAALAVAMMAGSSTALAATVTPADLDVSTYGTLIEGPTTDDFLDSSQTDIGDIRNWVYEDTSGASTLYTYVHQVTAGVNNISEFNTGFNVKGFNGVAGWDYTEASTAGGDGDADDFLITLDPDGTLDWNREAGSAAWWDSGEAITFFFQSNRPPRLGTYNLINSSVGTATSFAPVPLPPAGLMGLGLLGGLGLLSRMKKRRSA